MDCAFLTCFDFCGSRVGRRLSASWEGMPSVLFDIGLFSRIRSSFRSGLRCQGRLNMRLFRKASRFFGSFLSKS
jgi:hypothetical protein